MCVWILIMNTKIMKRLKLKKNCRWICQKVFLALLRRGRSYILEILDIKRIRGMKLLHVQTSKLLEQMCEVIRHTFDETVIKETGVLQALLKAARNGNVEFITGMTEANPDLLWNPKIRRKVFDVAVRNRQANIFSLIYGCRDKMAIVSYVNPDSTNLLHNAAKLGPSPSIPGEALYIQRELGLM